VNKKINPVTYSIGVLNQITPLYMVANQLNNLILVGMAITIVAEEKYALESILIPTVNIRRAHTKNPRKAMEIMAYNMPIFPKICFFVKVAIT
jgi:hypothetical protein